MGPALAVVAVVATVASTVAQSRAMSAQQKAQQSQLENQATSIRIQAQRQTEDLELEREQYEEQARQIQLQADQDETERRRQLVSALSTNAAFAAARGVTFEPGDSADALEKDLEKFAEEDIATERYNFLERKRQALTGAERVGTGIRRVNENVNLGLAQVEAQSRYSSEAFGASQAANVFAGVSSIASFGLKNEALLGKITGGKDPPAMPKIRVNARDQLEPY